MKRFIIFALSLSLLFLCGCRERRKARRNDGSSESYTIQHRHSGSGNGNHREVRQAVRRAPVPRENPELYAPGAVHASHRRHKAVVHPVSRSHYPPRRIISERSGEYIPPATRKFNNTPVATLDFKPALGDGYRKRSYRPAVYSSSAPKHFHRRHHFPPPRRHGPPRMHREGQHRPDRKPFASLPRHRESDSER